MVTEKVKAYIQSKDLFQANDELIVAVSGGVDSMVLLHLLHQLNNPITVAHCNFNLRGKASDADEELVRKVASNLGLPFTSKSFDTAEYAQEHGNSIQMAARELRYAWFEQLNQEGYGQWIVTAHHQNDVAETMLINLTKGTGLAGLHGIKPKNNNIVRPLLCLSRLEIEQYACEHQIDYREDASNADEKYLRNAIRHKVIPELEALNPSFVQHMNATARYIADSELLLLEQVRMKLDTCSEKQDKQLILSIKELQKLNPLRTYLYYFLQPYGFNESQVDNISRGLKEQAGQSYFSQTHQVLKDRDTLIVSELNSAQPVQVTIHTIDSFSNCSIEAELMEVVNPNQLDQGKNVAYLDFDKLNFPLSLRNWQPGDRFQPLGMKGQKKVSDYLIDEKINRLDKNSIQVLVNQNQICWLVNQRISEAFKVSSNTKKVLRLKTL